MAKVAIISLTVIATVPVVWEDLPNLTHEDGNRRQLRLRDYVNAPRGQLNFELHPDYTLPSGWRLSRTGNLAYNAVVGRTIVLRFKATRGSESAYSGELRITRHVAFVTRLIPNRINLGLTFNNTLNAQRVIAYNTTDLDVNPVRDFISVFNLAGDEQVSESHEVSDDNPEGRSGIGFDGTYYWVCGHDVAGGGTLKKFNTDGTVAATYTYTGGEIESIAFDGTAMWGLDIDRRQLRKFSTAGVEDTTAAVTLPRATTAADMNGIYLPGGQYGLEWADGHWWIPQFHIEGVQHHYVFCFTTAGVAVPTRHFAVPITPGTIVGLAYNPSTGDMWYMLDGEDSEGARFGTLRVHQIATV